MPPSAPPASHEPALDTGPPPLAIGQFFPALSTKGALELRQIDDALLAVVRMPEDELRFAVAEGDDFIVHPELSKGLPPIRHVVHLIGRLPAPLWLVTRTFEDSPTMSTWDEVFRLDHRGWKRVERAPADEAYNAVWESPEGCLVGLRGPGNYGADVRSEFAKVRAVDCEGKDPRLPAPTRSALSREYNYSGRGLPGGDLYLIADSAGLTVDKAESGEKLPLLLDIWRHDQPKPVVVPFPAEIVERPAQVRPNLLARAPGEIFVASNRIDPSDHDNAGQLLGDPAKWIPPFLLRFDGAAWSQIPLPPVTAFADIELAADGSLLLTGRSTGKYLGDSNEVWGMKPGGAWEKLGMLPVDAGTKQPRAAGQVYGRSLDDVWVLSPRSWGGEDVVFHNRRPKTLTVIAP